MSWYKTSYRKLFFDFHSPGTATGLAARFDAEAWAERLSEAGVQAVSVFIKCGFGYSFYRKGSVRYPHPHLPAGLDMVARQIAALHRRGLRAIGYYHTFNSEPIAREHPDWLVRDAAGNASDRQICMISPLFEEWMLPHLEEVASNYALDGLFFDGTRATGVCTCDACRKRFAAASDGRQVPAGPGEPGWGAYVAWKTAEFVRIRRRICDTLHRLRPDLVVSFNWAYAPRNPEAVPEQVGALVSDIHPDDQTFGGSYLSSYWALEERPFDVMNSAFLQWWGDWGCKPAAAMQQEVAGVLANGGLTWIGYQMNAAFDVEPAVLGEMARTLEFVREREPLLKESRAVPFVAVLHTRECLSPGAERFLVNEATLRGAHRALLERMIPHHLVSEHVLAKHLEEFSVVVLPDPGALGPELIGKLPDWVRRGGVFLVAGAAAISELPENDLTRCTLEGLLGVRCVGTYDQSHAYIEVADPRLKPRTLDMPHLAECSFALLEPAAEDVQTLAALKGIYLRSDGEFLLRWSPVGADTGHPAITVRPVGQGWAAAIAGDVFAAYQAKNQWNLKHIAANLLDALVERKPVSVEAPSWLHVVLRSQEDPGRLIVHLINPHGNRPVDGNGYCLETVLPVRDVELAIACTTPPEAVTLEPGGETLDWRWDDGRVHCRVPEVAIHRAVSLRFPAMATD